MQKSYVSEERGKQFRIEDSSSLDRKRNNHLETWSFENVEGKHTFLHNYFIIWTNALSSLHLLNSNTFFFLPKAGKTARTILHMWKCKYVDIISVSRLTQRVNGGVRVRIKVWWKREDIIFQTYFSKSFHEDLGSNV